MPMSNIEFLKRASKTVSKREELKEIDIEEEYCKHAKKRRCLALKLIILNKRGFPDRTTLCPGGRILFIEFKKNSSKKMSPIQIVVRRTIESFGFEYHLCDTIGQAEGILDRFLYIGKS